MSIDDGLGAQIEALLFLPGAGIRLRAGGGARGR